MPRLKIPTQETTAFGDQVGGRRANAGDFGMPGIEGVADKVGAAFSVIQDNADRANVSDVHAKMAQARAEWTVALQERAQGMQPGDTTFLPKFDADLQKYLGETEQNIVTSRAGQMAFQKAAADMRAHLFVSAGEYQAKAVGAKAVQDFGTYVDANTRTAITDPTQYDALLKQTRDAINDPNGLYAKVPGPQRAALLKKAEEDLTYGAAKGLILMGGEGPELALKRLKDNKYPTIDPQKMDDLIGMANSAIKERKREAEHAESLKAKERQVEQEKIMGDLLARINEPGKNGNGKMPSPAEIYGNQTLTPAQREHYLNIRDRKIKELSGDGEGKNPRAVRALLEGITAPDGAPNKTYSTEPITKAFADGKINSNELKQVLDFEKGFRGDAMGTLAQDAKAVTARTMKNMNASMGYLMQPDALSAAQNQVQFELQDAIIARKAEKKNPRDLLDPNSKDYFFTPSRMSTYFRTPQQSLADAAAAVAAGGRSTAAVPTAKNPKTGETLYYRDGKWQKQ